VFSVVSGDWSRDALVALGAEKTAPGARRLHRSLGFGVSAQMRGHTSKELDKNVVVRVILHGQCSLQRKEAR
jgi:hypothetical protein